MWKVTDSACENWIFILFSPSTVLIVAFNFLWQQSPKLNSKSQSIINIRYPVRCTILGTGSAVVTNTVLTPGSFLSSLLKAASMKDGKLGCGVGSINIQCWPYSCNLALSSNQPFTEPCYHWTLIFLFVFLFVCLYHLFLCSCITFCRSTLPCHFFLTTSNFTSSTNISPPPGSLPWYFSHCQSYWTELHLILVNHLHQNELLEDRIIFCVSLGPGA